MSAKSYGAIQNWWVIAQAKRGVFWKDFLDNHDPKRDNTWGGPTWIKAARPIKLIEHMHKGDIVVAYQAGEGVVGLAYLETDGYQGRTKRYDSFDLKRTPTVWLDELVPLGEIRRLPNAKRDIEFLRILRGGVFGITPRGFKKILDLILKYNPKQITEINRFLSMKRPTREAEVVAADEMGELKPTRKSTQTFQRTIRDSVAGTELKELYEYKCQVCGKTIELPDRKRYAEVHHLRPVGKPHYGKDGKPNTIVVCPQHHAMFDLGVIAIEPKSLTVKYWSSGVGEKHSKLILNHHLHNASLNYQYRKLFRGTRK
jgi:hypothetical protein